MVSGIFNAAVSGLRANAQQVGASADNIANVSTRGYKRTVLYPTSVTTPGSSTAYAPGGIQAVSRQLNDVQGLLAPATTTTDLAISGSGYFAVASSPQGGATVFTRDGSFAPDNQGFLVNTSGHYLLARAADGNPLQPVNVAQIGGTAQATTRIAVDANLPATPEAGETFTLNARATDSLGGSLDIAVSFEAQAGGGYRITVPSVTETATGVSTTTGYDVPLSFGGNGLIESFGGADAPPLLNISGLSNGAADLTVQFDFGAPGSANGLTQYGADFVLGGVQSDGAGYGGVAAVEVTQNGTVSATYDNGETRNIATIEVATFTNPQGLEALSGGVFQATDASGAPVFLVPGDSGAGTVQSGALELSTTDLGAEFSNLILAQSAYRANLAVIRTADEQSQSLLDELT